MQQPSPNSPLVWAHVGIASALPAVQEIILRAQLIEPSLRAMITTTPESNIHKAGVQVLHDSKTQSVQQFLSQTNPDICLWADMDVATPLFHQANKAQVPMMLLETGTKAMRKRPWVWRKTVAQPALRPVVFALADTADTAANLRTLGVPNGHIETLGPLTAGVVPHSCNETERDQMGEILTSQPVWLSASTPLQELDLVARAFVRTQRSAHRAVLILDLSDQADTIAATKTFQDHGLVVHHRAVEGEPDNRTQVFITDDAGELGLWYRLAALSYMGGTFCGAPPPNPLDAAALGSAIIHGPHIAKYSDAFDRLLHNKASYTVQKAAMLGDAVAQFLAPDACAELATAGWDVVSHGAAVIDRVVDVILGHLTLEGG